MSYIRFFTIVQNDKKFFTLFCEAERVGQRSAVGVSKKCRIQISLLTYPCH